MLGDKFGSKDGAGLAAMESDVECKTVGALLGIALGELVGV